MSDFHHAFVEKGDHCAFCKVPTQGVVRGPANSFGGFPCCESCYCTIDNQEGEDQMTPAVHDLHNEVKKLRQDLESMDRRLDENHEHNCAQATRVATIEKKANTLERDLGNPKRYIEDLDHRHQLLMTRVAELEYDMRDSSDPQVGVIANLKQHVSNLDTLSSGVALRLEDLSQALEKRTAPPETAPMLQKTERGWERENPCPLPAEDQEPDMSVDEFLEKLGPLPKNVGIRHSSRVFQVHPQVTAIFHCKTADPVLETGNPMLEITAGESELPKSLTSGWEGRTIQTRGWGRRVWRVLSTYRSGGGSCLGLYLGPAVIERTPTTTVGRTTYTPVNTPVRPAHSFAPGRLRRAAGTGWWLAKRVAFLGLLGYALETSGAVDLATATVPAIGLILEGVWRQATDGITWVW